MGRMTEAIDYINQPRKPRREDLWPYKHVSIGELEPIRRSVMKGGGAVCWSLSEGGGS